MGEGDRAMELLQRAMKSDPMNLDARVATAWVHAQNGRMAWGVSDVNSWYKNEHGHVAQNWPFTLLEYWQRTRQVDPDDYELV